MENRWMFCTGMSVQKFVYVPYNVHVFWQEIYTFSRMHFCKVQHTYST